jgi:hypothetical protein
LLSEKFYIPRKKKEVFGSDYAIGGIGPCPANAVVAGAWVKPEKLYENPS